MTAREPVSEHFRAPIDHVPFNLARLRVGKNQSAGKDPTFRRCSAGSAAHFANHWIGTPGRAPSRSAEPSVGLARSASRRGLCFAGILNEDGASDGTIRSVPGVALKTWSFRLAAQQRHRRQVHCDHRPIVTARSKPTYAVPQMLHLAARSQRAVPVVDAPAPAEPAQDSLVVRPQLRASPQEPFQRLGQIHGPPAQCHIAFPFDHRDRPFTAQLRGKVPAIPQATHAAVQLAPFGRLAAIGPAARRVALDAQDAQRHTLAADFQLGVRVRRSMH